MEQTLEDLAELAETIAEENIIGNKVDLYSIAAKKDISIIEGNYKQYFLGELVHKSGKFYIHLNMDKLETSGRKRFTIAHEYGHYFTDAHRNNLISGISLAHTSDHAPNIQTQFEKQADHFASNLLMPTTRFISNSKEIGYGLDAILKLKESFDTSIESTAIRYTSLDIDPCLFVRWNEDFSEKYSAYSASFGKIVGIKGKPIIKINGAYLKDISENINVLSETEYPIHEAVTNMSYWIATIAPNTTKNIIALEQTIKLGNYGGLTFILLK